MTTARGLHRRLDTAHAEAQARDGNMVEGWGSVRARRRHTDASIGDDMEKADARGRGMRKSHETPAEAPAPDEVEAMAAVPAHARAAVSMLAFARGGADLVPAASDLAAVAPRDADEARLAALKIAICDAAVYELALASVAKAGGTREHRLAALGMADRLTRTVVTLTEAIERRRRPPEQRIVVERVMVAEGGQAVVGIVPQAVGGGGDGSKDEHRPHAPAALAHEPGAEMRGADPGRAPVPVAGNGEGPLPDARRGEGQRRAGGAAQRQLASRPEKPRDHRGAHDRAAAAAPGQGRAGG